MGNLNRRKVVLAEKNKTARWLSEQIEKNPTTVSNWCRNISQPSLETLSKVAKVLEVDIRELLISTAQ